MDGMLTRTRLLLGAAAVLAVVVVPVAVAASDDASSAAQSKASVEKKVKKLAKKVRKLNRRINELERQPGPQGPAGAVGPGGPQGSPGPQGPPGPSTGPAGGDLDGTYPNPEIAPNAVGSPELAPDAVTTTKIANGAVGALDILDRAVGGDEVAAFNVVEESISVPPNGGIREITADCPFGTRIISGGAFFPFASGYISASHEDPDVSGWRAFGQNNGTQAQDLTAQALCLTPGFSP